MQQLVKLTARARQMNCLCIFGHKGAIQIHYYYYLTFFNLPRPTAATATTA